MIRMQSKLAAVIVVIGAMGSVASAQPRRGGRFASPATGRPPVYVEAGYRGHGGRSPGIYPVRPPVIYSVRPPVAYSVRPPVAYPVRPSVAYPVRSSVAYPAGGYRGYGARPPMIVYGGVYLVEGHTVYVPPPSYPAPPQPVVVIDGQPYAVYSPSNSPPDAAAASQRPVVATNGTPAQPDHGLRDATEILGFGTAALKFLAVVAELLA